MNSLAAYNKAVWQNAGLTQGQLAADRYSALVICDDVLNKL